MDNTSEMDSGTLPDLAVSIVDGDHDNGIEETRNDNGEMKGITSKKEVMGEVASGLLRLELHLACTSEKLVNMNLFMMHVAAAEGDFEAFASGKEDSLDESALMALEFDILSGFFGSEIREMDKYVHLLQGEVNDASQMISAHQHPGGVYKVMEEKLYDAEESIKQSQKQVSELLTQAAMFQKILSKFNGVETSIEEKEVAILDSDDSFSTHVNLKIQNPEQQRHLLRMLEKSLARELDIENKLTECTQALDAMKFRLQSSKQEILSMEEETAAVYAQFLEADNTSAVLMGISKDFMGQLQSCQLTINSAMRRESDLKVRLQTSMQLVQRLEKKEVDSQELAERKQLEVSLLKEKVNSLEEQLKASESMLLSQSTSLDGNDDKLKELEGKVAVAEIRAEKAEEQCKWLAEANIGLTKDLDHLKGSCIPREKAESLEKQLLETNIQLQQAMAYVEASQEQQSMLFTSINDMNALIEKLKSNVLKTDARADNAEEKCIILSESNAELNEELNFLRGKLECLEVSLQQAEEIKLATAKDIDIRTQMITDLIMQLAIERDRLHKQMSFLMKENRALVEKLHLANKAASDFTQHEGEKDEEILSSKVHVDYISKEENGVQVSDITEEGKLPTTKETLDGEFKPESEDMKSKLETVRSIDPGWLSINYVMTSIVTVLIAVLAACFFWPENCPF